jgi:ABC-type multidrug transport system ATPase subunit
MGDLATKHHKTILVSSHLLAEIERTATHVGIINKGELLFQGTINDLHNLSKPTVKIETNNQEKTSQILSAAGTEVIQKDENTVSINFTNKDDMGKLNSLLVQNGITVYGIGKERKDLENLFLDITSKN